MQPDAAGGLRPTGPGWFVVNVADAAAERHQVAGAYVPFEGTVPFAQFGVNIHVLLPGEPNGLYHAEDAQEAFLVLEGECVLIVEGEERRLERWDFFHAPAGTAHILVGGGDGPCWILMAGARVPGREIVYPVDETALRYDAGVRKETTSAQEAYAMWPDEMTPTRLPPPG